MLTKEMIKPIPKYMVAIISGKMENGIPANANTLTPIPSPLILII